MSKYSPLWEYIKTNEPDMLTFREIEKLLGFEIDHSFLRYKSELGQYGYEIGKISMKDQTVKIVKQQK